MQGLQQRLAEAEEAHKEELVDLQATIQSCSAKLQDSKVLLWGPSDPYAAHGATSGKSADVYCMLPALSHEI